MRQSIRTRLIISFIGLAVIPLLLVGILIGAQAFRAESSQAVILEDQIAARTSILVSNLFEKLEAELETIARQPELRESSPVQQQILLSGLLSRQKAFDSVFLLDGKGMEQVGVSRTFAIADSDLASRAGLDEFEQPVATQGIYYSHVYTDDRTGEPVITAALPIVDVTSGQVAAVLVADMRFIAVQDLIIDDIFSRSETGVQNTIYMVDADGHVIAHNDPSVTLRGVSFAPPTVDGIENGLGGERVVLATEPVNLGNETFTIVAETPVSQALALAYDTGLILTALLVMALAVSVVVGLVLVNQIVQPIQSLATAAGAIQKGDLSKRAPVNRNDEIGAMAHAFNDMTDQLQSTLKGLQDHIDDLEKARVERENLIKDLQAARRLAEENSRLKSEFLSTMSHELRTPLNAIEGFTGIILNRIGGTDFNPKTEGYLTRIRSNSKRLLQLINDFLDLSRVEAGRLELANQPFSPGKLVKRWQDEIGVLASQKGLQLEVNFDDTLPETLYGDEEAISKVALNLLGNAIKFTEQGQIKLAMERTEDRLDITVEDTGIGIPPHAREFIFEEFRQVDQTSKRKYGGTGLGLAIVQKYTRAAVSSPLRPITPTIPSRKLPNGGLTAIFRSPSARTAWSNISVKS